MGSIDESRDRMINFLDELERTQKQDAAKEKRRNLPEFKLRKIQSEKELARENCSRKIFERIYLDALPVEEEYKHAHMKELGAGVYSFIQDRCPKGAAMYLVESSKRGCLPAKRILESVNEYVDKHFKRFYENLESTDIDEIKMDTDSTEVETNLDKISSDMDLDEISEIIENNVRSTIQHEIKQTKEEDEKIKSLQEKLAADENVMTEDALEKELWKNGIKKKNYKPRLFEAIMMHKIENIQESAEEGIDPSLVQKEAFFESVEEFTKWSMVTVLNMENLGGERYQRLANKYAQANHYPEKYRQKVTTVKL